MKKVSNKIQKAVQVIKNKIDSLKKSTQSNEVKIKINNKEASKQISQLEKEIDSLKRKINARQMKLDIINPQMDKIVNDTRKQVVPEGISKNDKSMDTVVNNALSSNKDFISLDTQAQKLYTEIEMYNKQLNEAKTKMSQLKQETNQTGGSQNKLTAYFSAFKKKIEQTKPSINGLKNSFNKMPKITKNITNNISKMGSGVKQGLGHILKYAGALLSLRGIYSTLSSCASTWLSSQNSGAKQLSTNIDYMKYSMGSAFAPVIQYVINLIYQLMKAIQSVVFALFKVKIFANASAKSYSNMAGSAKKAKQETKALAGIHDEINNVQQNDNSDSGSGNSGVTPSFDLSGLDSQMSPFAQKLYDFFKPLKESWDIHGPKVVSAFKNAFDGIGTAVGAMWSSVETIFTNGTIYSIIANILNSIGTIGKSWANAWNNDNNGTEIIQTIANMIKNVTDTIVNLVSSTGFQTFLNGILSAFSGIVQFLEPIQSGFVEMLGIILEIVASTIGNILQLIGNALQSIAQNEVASEILKAVGAAIAIIVAGIIAWNVAQLILNGLMGLFAIITSPITLIILAIVAAITAIILIIKNWGKISEWFGNLWHTIGEKIKEIWNGIKEFFSNIWNGIKNTAVSIFNGIKDTISNVFNTIKNTISNIWNNIVNTISNVWNTIVNKVKEGVSGAWNAITSVFGNIANWFKNIFTNAWQAVKNVFSTGGKIFDGIKEGIVNAFKSVVNAIINGINKVIAIPFNAINNVLNGIRSINILGVEPFTWIHTFNVPQIPQLAKGNVAYEPLFAMFGEYSGASNNPEITTPQNIMRETFEDVLASKEWNNNSDRPMRVQFIVGGKMFVDEIIDGINERTRQTGKAQIKVSYE